MSIADVVFIAGMTSTFLFLWLSELSSPDPDHHVGVGRWLILSTVWFIIWPTLVISALIGRYRRRAG